MAVSAPAAHRPTTAALARAAGIVALAMVAVSGVLIALAGAAADHGFLVPGLIRAWAGWVAGPLSGAGISTPLRVFFVELAVLTAAYAAVVALAPSIGLRWIAAAAVLLNLAFLLAPPLLSNDVFSYIDVARLFGRYHLDPYVFTPRAVRHDPVFVFVHWRRSVTDYGPLFTLGARPLGLLTVAQALWAFKAVAGLASLGCTALVGWIAHRRGSSAARAVAVFGLNPIVLVWTVAGAHNDLLMMLLVLGGTALLLAERPLTAGVTLVAAAAIKLSAGIAIPFLVARRAPAGCGCWPASPPRPRSSWRSRSVRSPTTRWACSPSCACSRGSPTWAASRAASPSRSGGRRSRRRRCACCTSARRS